MNCDEEFKRKSTQNKREKENPQVGRYCFQLAFFFFIFFFSSYFLLLLPLLFHHCSHKKEGMVGI